VDSGRVVGLKKEVEEGISRQDQADGTGASVHYIFILEAMCTVYFGVLAAQATDRWGVWGDRGVEGARTPFFP
jgi:hypothetical protein